MGGTEFWLHFDEETSLALNDASPVATLSTSDSNISQSTGDETATLEQTLLTFFNDMVEPINGVSDARTESLPTADGATFNPRETMVDLSSLAWPEEISL